MINIKPFRIKSKAVVITAVIILSACNSVKQVASPSAIVITEVKQTTDTNPTVVVVTPPTETLPPIAVDPPKEEPKPVAPVCGTFNINIARWSAYQVNIPNPSCEVHTCRIERVDIGNGSLNGFGEATILGRSEGTVTLNGDMNKTLTGNSVCGREYQVDAFCDGKQMSGAWGTKVKSDACPTPVIPPTPPQTPPVVCTPNNNIVWGDWVKGSPVAGKATNVPCTKYNWHRDGKDSCGVVKSQDAQSCEKPGA